METHNLFVRLKRFEAKLYGLPKVHKDGTSMRPILSTIGSANYIVAKILNNFLKEFNHNQYVCKDVFNFTEEINALNSTKNDCMVSFDVKSVFTMVPLDETIQTCIQKHTSTLVVLM